MCESQLQTVRVKLSFSQSFHLVHKVHILLVSLLYFSKLVGAFVNTAHVWVGC